MKKDIRMEIAFRKCFTIHAIVYHVTEDFVCLQLSHL